MSLLNDPASVKDLETVALRMGTAPFIARSETGTDKGEQRRQAPTGPEPVPLDNLAVLHMHDPVGLGGKLVIVGHDHEGGATHFVQLAHEGKQCLAGMRI